MINPWPDVATARQFLRGLVYDEVENSPQNVSLEQLVPWIEAFGLGPLTFRRYRSAWPELTTRLMGDAFSAMAENSLHFESLKQVLAVLDSAEITPLLLKGTALAEAAYGDVGLRPMSDIDLWLPADDVPTAVTLIQQAGYHIPVKDRRPLEQQRVLAGEIGLVHPQWEQGMVDLHWSPFNGWWFRHTANIDIDALWQRREEIEVAGCQVYRLSAEDMILHLAAHLAVNAHFGPHAAIRGCIDIILASKAWPVDWQRLVERAQEWRVTTALWLVLQLCDDLIGIDTHGALAQLQPSTIRRHYLQRLVSVDSILAGRNLSPTMWRIPLILSLVDRPRDALKFIFRMLWPDPEWREANR